MEGEDIIIVRLDIFGCKTEYDFYNALAVAVLKQTVSKMQLWMEEARDFLVRLTPRIGIPVDPVSEISVSLGITPETHSPEEVLNIVEDIAKRKNRRVVVCSTSFSRWGSLRTPDRCRLAYAPYGSSTTTPPIVFMAARVSLLDEPAESHRLGYPFRL